jgi:hypothetical protein
MGSSGRTPGRTRWPLAIAALAVALLLPTGALAFPGTNPDESVRINTPNDPEFDQCESDDEDGTQECTNVFDEEFERFGFAPDGSQITALYDVTAAPPRQVAQNTAAGRNPLGQVSGVSADRAWKYFGELDSDGPSGDPNVEVAILDTGIRWDRAELRKKVALNEGELPEPQTAGGAPCGSDDCNGDGAFDVDDFADDPRVSETDGHPEGDGFLDASDLIAAFSGDGDNDSNGYADDVAGWDFFDDDNDPYDASSYSSAGNHGSGRAAEAGAETDNAEGGTGVCPACQIVPLRVWDTFVVDSNNFAQGVLYAADNGIEVVEGAVGGLTNTSFAREAFAYAYEHGTIPVMVSSDLNTANHNYPTNYAEAMMVQGTVADVHGLGENPPQEFIDFFNALGVPLATNAPIGTWFRNSGTTQYGGHAHVVMPAVTGSAATGQASGAAGLVASYGRLRSGQIGGALAPNEIKQLITMTAEDVLPQNTDGLGVPDPAQEGWDQHFGYGRPDLGLALERIRNEAVGQNPSQQIPPQVLITSPDWFAPLNLEAQAQVEVEARLSADRAPLQGGERYDWVLEWAPGIEPCEDDFEGVATGSGSGELDATLAAIDLAQVREALDDRVFSSSCPNPSQPVEGGSTPDPTVPAKGPGDLDPNEPAFTVRVVVTDTQGNRAEDRRTLFVYRDTTLHEGWSRPIGGQANDDGVSTTGGEASHRMFDLDGDNELEVIEATSSGQVHVLRGDGAPLPSFNSGEPVETQQYPNVHPGAPAYGQVSPPLETARTPAIGDIDGDMEPEIVDSAGEHVYAWEADGSTVAGFPVRLDPALSAVPDRTRENHIKRGFTASPALGDLVGDGALEIVVPALDQHVYAWDGDGDSLPGFPVRLRESDGGGPIPCSGDFECAEIINTAAIGNIAGDARPEIVVPTAEFDDNPSAPEPPSGLGGFGGILTNFLANVLGGSGRVYALDANGDILPGWPTKPNGIVPDALPFVGPGVDHVLGNVDGDPELEAIGGVATGEVTATDGNGSKAEDYDSEPAAGEHVDKSRVLNLFENPIVANLDPVSPGLEVLKGGVTLNGLVNIGVAVGQNLPYNHVLQAWNGQSGVALPAFPQAVEDFQLLSSPAVADLSSAPGAEATLGTGLYLIRNVNVAGVEGSGWPKFTGGWNFAVPAVGDLDGDEMLEVSALTREGFSFLWDTDRPVCGANDEWWTSRHDEWSTGAYGTDTRPPGTPEELEAVRSDDGSVRVSWTAPGDDWLCGTPAKLRILVSENPIEHPTDGTVLLDEDSTAAAGEADERTLTGEQLASARFLAVLYRDEAGNWGHVATVEVPAQGADIPGPGTGPGTSGAACANVIKGSGGNDKLNGSAAGDRINGRRGSDRIKGGAGDDCLKGGRGRDRIGGGDGEDEIKVRGGGRDRVNCGAGEDKVLAARNDRVRNCEEVKR